MRKKSYNWSSSLPDIIRGYTKKNDDGQKYYRTPKGQTYTWDNRDIYRREELDYEEEDIQFNNVFTGWFSSSDSVGKIQKT